MVYWKKFEAVVPDAPYAHKQKSINDKGSGDRFRWKGRELTGGLAPT